VKIKNIVLIFISIICLGCSFLQRKQPMFGQEYNDVRIKNKIPVIPNDWNFSLGTEDVNWYNPNTSELKEAKIPFHYSKYVNYKSGSLTYEQDIYMGYEDYTFDDTLLREKIYITYYYYVNDIPFNSSSVFSLQDQNWVAEYSSKDGFLETISLEEAKIILASWGISYP